MSGSKCSVFGVLKIELLGLLWLVDFQQYLYVDIITYRPIDDLDPPSTHFQQIDHTHAYITILDLEMCKSPNHSA